jgi:membrane protease YdiL (CAAX protease family)
MIGSIGGAMPPWPVLGWAFATLLAAGLILAWMTVRTGSLMASIGLHGCWILGQQAFNRSAYFIVQPPEAFLPFFGAPQCNGMVPVGLIPLASLLIAGLLVGILLRYRAMPPIYPLGAR